jgi:hypothetical protein
MRGEDDVIEHPNAHQGCRPADPFGETTILRGWCGISGRMVVKADDARRRSEDRWFEHVGRRYVNRVHRANSTQLLGQDEVPGIQREDEKLFPCAPPHTMPVKVVDLLTAGYGRTVDWQR